MLAQALSQHLNLRILHPGLIFAKALTDVGADERLIAGEAERRRDLFQIFDYVFGNANADSRHLSIFLQALLDSFTRRLHTQPLVTPCIYIVYFLVKHLDLHTCIPEGARRLRVSPRPYSIAPLNFLAFRRILKKQTNLSAWVAVSLPAGGEMSGLTAHFLFGSNFLRNCPIWAAIGPRIRRWLGRDSVGDREQWR